MTKKYYIWCLVTAPTLAALIAFSNMNMLLALGAGLFTEFGLIMAGFALGKREKNNESKT